MPSRSGTLPGRQAAWWFFAGVAVGGVLALTVFPGSPAPYRWLIGEVATPLGPYGVAATLNVLLFVPIGALIALTQRPRLLWLAPAFSVMIETVQWIIPERNPDPADIALNSAGALVGYGMVALTRRAYLRRQADRGAGSMEWAHDASSSTTSRPVDPGVSLDAPSRCGERGVGSHGNAL